MRHFWERYFSFCDRAGKDRYGKQWLLRIIWPLKKARPFIFLRLMLQIRLYFTNKRSPGSAPVWIKSNTRKHVEKDSTAKPLEMFALHRALSGILTQINTSCYLLSSFFFWSLKVHQTGLDINFMGSWSECYSELIDTSEFTNAAFFFFSKSRVGMKTTSQTNGNIDIINLYNSIWHLNCFLYMFSLIWSEIKPTSRMACYTEPSGKRFGTGQGRKMLIYWQK